MKKYYLACILFIFFLSLFSCNSSKEIYNKTSQKDDIVNYERIRQLISTGDSEAALEEYKKTIKEKEESALLKLFYSRLLFLSGKNKEAKEKLQSIISDNIKNVDALFSLALAYGMDENREKQKTILLKLIEIDPNHSLALAYLGEIYLNERKIVDAQRYFTRSINSDPENYIALIGLGHVFMIKKKYNTSVDYLNKAIKLDPKNIFAYIDRARANEKNKNINGAILDLTEAIKINPDYYWSYIDRGKLSLKSGKMDEAIKDFSEAKKIDPDYFLAYVYLGGIYYQKKQWNNARMCYQNIIKLKPEYHYIYEPYGVVYYVKEDWINASNMFKKAFDYNKNNLSYPLLVTLCLKKGGKEHEAREYIQKILKIIPTDSWYYEMVNFYLNPSYDYKVQQKYKNEKNKIRKNRILFYIGAQYALLKNMKRTAFTSFFDVTNIERKDFIEYDLAVWELEKLKRLK